MLKNKYSVEFVTDKKNYIELAKDFKIHFLQSWDWGMFKANFFWRSKRIVVKDTVNGRIKAVGQFLLRDIKFGYNFAYFPKGPKIDYDNYEELKMIINKINNFITNEIDKCVFIRYEMELLEHIDYNQMNKDYDKIFKDLGFKKSPSDIQIRDTRKIKLKSKKEIWESFKSKQRTKIRKAKKSNVDIKKIDNERELKKWYDLNKQKAKRVNIFIHDYRYYKNYFKMFVLNGKSNFYCAYYKNKLVSGVFISNYGDESIYQYSAGIKTKVYFNDLIQWKVIKDCINNGKIWYDLWGVAPDEDDKSHPLYGVTRFKRKFGGSHYRYIGCFDYPISSLGYKLLMFAEKQRKNILNLKKWLRKKIK